MAAAASAALPLASGNKPFDPDLADLR